LLPLLLLPLLSACEEVPVSPSTTPVIGQHNQAAATGSDGWDDTSWKDTPWDDGTSSSQSEPTTDDGSSSTVTPDYSTPPISAGDGWNDGGSQSSIDPAAGWNDSGSASPASDSSSEGSSDGSSSDGWD
jgi:hypothetical protein